MKDGVVTVEGAQLSKINEMGNTIKLREIFPKFSSLSARETGLVVRQILEREIENSVITLDFENIELITQGFADEVIGVLIRDRGIDFVKSKIKVINANDFIKGVLNWVASYRKKISQNICSS